MAARNKFSSHVLVIPEDDANRQIANGFCLDIAIAGNRIQVLEEAGGWSSVLNDFCENQIKDMERYAARLMVLVVDFDRNVGRLQKFRDSIPPNLSERVFVIGTWSEPEELRSVTGKSFEELGRDLARDCRQGTNLLWSHDLLRNNADELARLNMAVKPFLFP